MNIRHIGMLTLRRETTAPEADAILDGLHGLKDLVPGVVSVAAQRDLGLKDGNADIHFDVAFASEEDWQAYQRHPAHVALIRQLIAPAITAKAFIQVEG